ACARLGAVVVALNPRYRGHELTYILGQSAARAVLLTDHLGGIDYFETLADVLPDLAQAIPGAIQDARCPTPRPGLVDADDEDPGCIRLRGVFDAGNEAGADRAPAPNADDVFTLLYTSGTTSFPKGAMISHRNSVPHAWNVGEVLRLTPDDRVLHAPPAARTGGGGHSPLPTWAHCAR